MQRLQPHLQSELMEHVLKGPILLPFDHDLEGPLQTPTFIEFLCPFWLHTLFASTDWPLSF